MPTYYFNINTSSKVMDRAGLSLRDQRAARDYATHLADALTARGPEKAEGTVVVTNEQGEVLFDVPIAPRAGN
jgi:hypothetical protein